MLLHTISLSPLLVHKERRRQRKQYYLHRAIIRQKWWGKTKQTTDDTVPSLTLMELKKELAHLCLLSAAPLCFLLISTSQCCGMGRFCNASLSCFLVWSSALAKKKKKTLANWVCSSPLGCQRALSALKGRAEEYTGQKKKEKLLKPKSPSSFPMRVCAVVARTAWPEAERKIMQVHDDKEEF